MHNKLQFERKGRDYLGYLGVDSRIIFKSVLRGSEGIQWILWQAYLNTVGNEPSNDYPLLKNNSSYNKSTT